VVDELVIMLKSLLTDALEEVGDDATLVSNAVLDVLGLLLPPMLDMLGLEVANVLERDKDSVELVLHEFALLELLLVS
jgi:hypothetical protein